MAPRRRCQRFVNVGERFENPLIIDEDGPVRYQPPRTPTTLRRPSDETDTESVASDSTEDSITDNGEELTTDRRTRLVRIWQAKWRVNNTLKYANDGLDSTLQSASDGVNHEVQHLYDVARPVYRESVLQLRVASIMSIYAFAHVLIFSIDMLGFCFSIIFGSIRWLWWIGVSAVVILGKTSSVCIGVLFQSLGTLLRWFVRDGIKLACFLGVFWIIFTSLSDGLLGTTVHVCNPSTPNDTKFLNARWFLQHTCNSSGVKNIIQDVNSELAALVDASDAVIQTTDDMVHPLLINVHRSSHHLASNLTRLREFAIAHLLFDPTFQSSEKDTHAISTVRSQGDPTVYAEMHEHARAIMKSAQIVQHEYTIRWDELNTRLNSIQEYAKKSKSHSALEGFFINTFSSVLPAVFTSTSTHRQASDYATVARQILNQTLTESLLEKPPAIAWRIERISDSMPIVRDQLLDFRDKWTDTCQEWREKHPGWHHDEVMANIKHRGQDKIENGLASLMKCEYEPEEMIQNLDAIIETVQTEVDQMTQASNQHETVMAGLVAVHKQLHDLLDNAAGWEGVSRNPRLLSHLVEPRSCKGLARCRGMGYREPIKIDPLTARTILRTFVAHVGDMGIHLGRQRRTEEVEIPMGKFKWYMKDGEVKQHPVHWDFWNNVDYPGKPESRDGWIVKAGDLFDWAFDAW